MPPAPERQAGVARSTGTAMLTQLVTAGFTAVLTLFLIRRLGPEEFGVFSLALGVAALAMLPADLGIAHSVGRFVAERRGDDASVARVIAAGLRLKLLSGAAVGVALALLAGPLAAAYDEPALAWTLRAMAVAVFAQSLLAFYTLVYISLGRLEINLRLITFESTLEVAASITLVLAAGGAAAAGWGRAIGYGVAAAAALLLALRRFGRGSISLRAVPGVPPIARYAGVMFVVNGIYSLFSQVDLLLIGALLSAAAVGQFSAPLRLFVLLYYPGLAVSNAVSPRMARGDGQAPDADLFRQCLRLLIVFHAVLLAPLLVWAEPIADLALGDDYRESADVIRVMAPLVVMQGVGPLLAVSINYLGEARRRVPVAVLGLLVNVVIDIVLLREIGVVAAAIGCVVGFAIYLAGHALICHRILDLRPREVALTTARSLVAAAVMAGVLVLFGTGEVSVLVLVAGSVAGAAAYFAALVVTREIGPADLALVRSLLRRT